MLILDKDDSWEVMSAVSLTSHKGYNRVMTRLLKKSNQLVMVWDGIVGTTFSCSNLYRNVFFGMIIFIKMQEDAPLVMVRLRVVKLLGHLGGKINRNLVTGNLFLFKFAMLAKRAALICMP